MEGKTLKFLDLFGGIGGFRTGLEKVGHQCVGYVEIDKYARKSYENIYNTEGEWTAHDITKVTDEEWRELRGRVDIITGGFPCQAFSTAGKRRGFDDTRGTLFFEVARAAKEIQPSFLFLENVKGLFSHDKGQTFGTIIQALDELGYVVEWGLFNSKFWGVPQNRERVFILATRKDVFEKPKLFDLLKQQENFKQTSKLLDVLEDKVDEKFYLTEEQMSKLVIKLNSPDREIKQVANRKGYNNNTRTYDPIGISGALDTAGGGGRELHIKVVGNTSNTGHRSHDVHDPTGVSPTIAARDYKGGDFDVKKIERNTVEILCALQREVGEEEIAKWRFRIFDTFQQEEILRQDVHEAGLDIEQSREALERENQSGERKNEDRTFDGQKIMREMPINKEFGRSSYGRESIQQFARELTIIMQKLSLETSQEENLLNLRETTQGVGILRQALSEIQEVWRPFLYQKPSIRIRKLVPLEVWRLQGFTDEQFYKAKNAGISNSQLYKQAGNSVTVNVIEAIAKTL